MYGAGGYSAGAGYGAGGGYSHSQGYSGTSAGYATSGYAGSFAGNYFQPETPHFSSNENFLAEDRPMTPMVSNMGDVKEVVEMTFEKITGQEFPHDSIKIVVCDEQTLRQVHSNTGGAWSPGVMGFSFNKYGKGISEIYVKQDHLDSILLTIGHELGHVLGPTLPNGQDEEAKAHAFSLAWIETIREHNIGGLQPNIIPNPAHNGLHDVAFDYVKYLLQTGASSFDVFKTLAHGLTSIVAQI
jgi:hypothetical protein